MRLVADSGLWSTGHHWRHPQLIAVLEVSGAVLSWTVDDPSAAAQITFTDPARADWFWRVLGESGHSALAAALDGRTPDAAVELTGVNVLPGVARTAAAARTWALAAPLVARQPPRRHRGPRRRAPRR